MATLLENADRLSGAYSSEPAASRAAATTASIRDASPLHEPQHFVVRHDPRYEAIKRVMDIAGALTIGAISLLLLPFLAIVIRLDSRGPIFYKQTRVGKDEKLFTIWKFRSMRSDAEKDGAQWASTNDNRVTRVGGFMRKCRLDELPQVWNVLVGEMSFVGPRPERPEFVELLEQEIPNYSARHLVKTGITGWAQIKHSYAGTIEDSKIKHAYDMEYIQQASLKLDLQILLMTVGELVRMKGR